MIIFLKKALSWLKNYWYVPAILVGALVLTLINREVPKSLMKMIAKRRAVHEKEVEIIEKAHEEEKAKKEAALEKYHETIQRIEEKYEKDKSELSLLKKRKIKKIIEETGDDSDLLAQKLSDQFGFDVVYDEEEETKQ